MRNLKISHQLLGMVALLALAFVSVTFYELRSSIGAIYAERYDMLRTQVESGISILQAYDNREKSGELSHEEAQKQAFATLASIKYEPSGYLFGMDYDTVTKFHPNPKFIGVNQKAQPGNTTSEQLVAKGRAAGGITVFNWPKPGMPADQQFEKATYSKVFEPWQIVVATGVYTDDLDAKVQKTIMEVVSFGLIAFLLALGVAFIVIRNITKPLASVHSALEAVANENVKLAIPHTDMSNEVGMMAKATQALQEKIRERHAMTEREEKQKTELDRERQQNLDLQQQEAASQARVVSTIGEALESLAHGDLTIRCADLGPRYETLRHNFNDALVHLEAAMSKVNAKGIDIGGSKEEIRRASNELSQRTERQAA
ncbi:cache domain-containing protein, partial [Neorhizobium vignae]|uniref:cache domain-containing protein n=1 Tax=Neorhizobium vignae TaxID=690585 RepID=UPI00055E1D44